MPTNKIKESNDSELVNINIYIYKYIYIYLYDRKLYYLKKLNDRIKVPNKFMSLNSTKTEWYVWVWHMVIYI